MEWTRLPPNQWLATMLTFDRCLQMPDTEFTETLPRFQRDAAVRVLDLLERFGACLLADDIGLGKTHVADAVIRSLASSSTPVLVVAPASVLPSWRRIVGPQMHVTFSSYARLISRSEPLNDVDLVVVDEAPTGCGSIQHVV